MKVLLVLVSVLVAHGAVAQDSLRQSVNDIITLKPGVVKDNADCKGFFIFGHPPKSIRGNLFTLADAESILGEPAHLHSTVKGNDSESFGEITEYAANDTNKVAGKVPVIQFTYERFGRPSDAKKRYRSFTSQLSDGFAPDPIEDFGDDGYVFRYGTVFSLVVRKYDTVITIDVPNLRRDMPEDALLQVARRIVERL